MMDLNLFRMPSSSRLLLLSAIFSLTSALPWPAPDATASYKPADWIPRPTNVPGSPLPDLLKRDASGSSICGWFNGNFNQPSECSSGEDCVYDTNHAVVGCCPVSGSCTTGVHTTCVNFEQGAPNPSVLTCSGESVCYSNTYPGGYYQYGCGASTDGQTVATTYSGQDWSSQLEILYIQLTLITTQPATSTVPSTTSVAQSSSSSIPLSISSSSTSLSSSFSSSSTPSAASSNTLSTKTSATSQTSSSTTISAAAQLATNTNAATDAATGSVPQSKVGIIAGSVVGGVGVVFAIMALACVLLRRRRNKKADEWARSIPKKEKTMSTSSYASSQMSDHARIHPFSPDDIVSPLTPLQQTAPALVQPVLIIQPQEGEYSSRESEDSEVEHIEPEDTSNVQQSIETERSSIRRVQLADGPSIDDIADLPPPWVRPPTPPPRSPKRLTIRVHPPEDQTPLDIYLKSQSTPIHHSVSVTSNTSDTSRYSRTTDGRSIIESMNSGSWNQGEVPPVPIMRKPVGSGWYRPTIAPMEKSSNDHVAFQLAGDSDTGRSLTAPQQTQERSKSMTSEASVTENVSLRDSFLQATNFDFHELDITGSASDWVAPLRLSTFNVSPVTKRGRTPVPILGVPAAPSPSGRGKRLYEV